MQPYDKMRSIMRSGVYTDEEDARLIELYKQYSDKKEKWKIIASKLNRCYKSVRERYVNHLDHTIDKVELSAEEKSKIDEFQSSSRYRGKWPEIAKELSLNREQGRRTELQIKNYWNSKDRAQKRRNKRKERSYERISRIMSINYITDD